MELDDFQKAFGARLQKVRRRKGISQRRLSVETGMSEGYLSRLEHGRVNATLDIVRRLGIALGVRARTFFEF